MSTTIDRVRVGMAALLLVMGLGWLWVPPAEAQENQVLEIANRRQLFVDHRLIDTMEGLRLELQEPRPANTVLKIEKPWEGDTLSALSEHNRMLNLAEALHRVEADDIVLSFSGIGRIDSLMIGGLPPTYAQR